MRLGAFFTIYNGTELLNGAIRNIEPYVDVILLHYQNTSNTGHKSDEFRLWYEENRELLSPKIKILKYKPINKWKLTKVNEARKHTDAIDFLRKEGCTHFMMAACDHYYNPHEFKSAKEELICVPKDVTWTKMYTYYKCPTWRIDPMENYCMPFICKLTSKTRIGGRLPVLVDPSCNITPFRTHKGFEPERLILHHFSMIRQDIKSKFKNAAASINWPPELVKALIHEYENYDIKANPGVKYYQGRKIKVVPNWFNI